MTRTEWKWQYKQGIAKGVYLLNDANGKAIGEIRGTKERANLAAAAPELLGVLRKITAMFSKGHAISQFNWADSALSAESIQELNEIPTLARNLLSRFEVSR